MKMNELFEDGNFSSHDEMLEESVISRIKAVFRRMFPPRIKVGLYMKSDRDYIATASRGNQHSLLHVEQGRRHYSMTDTIKDDVDSYVKEKEAQGYKKVRAARNIAGAITRIGPAILSYAITGSAIAIGYGALVYFMGRRGQNEFDAISSQLGVEEREKIQALQRSMDNELDVSLDQYIDNITKELADKYRDRAIDPSTIPSGSGIQTIDVDALLRGQ